ncbi:hypothetical protein Gotri_011529 [Gossypium trilobum]|uniref:RNase H type-1 domain-containing protein n=1 Tax=Gossypium trilobum TaxID=34281 RepID=A0A7J9EU13_9ROSI|nr:hypothetical protein [Gossypium trilobum]
MTVVESVVKLGLEKDKLGSSKSEERAYVKKITRKILLMAMATATIVVAKVSEEVCHQGNDGGDKESKKLGSRKGKAEVNRAKRSKKKLVKCFLCYGPHELRNCPKQVEVKGKVTSKLGELSEGLPPKEEVSLSSDLEGKFTMKTVKLGLMRLKLSEASEGPFEVLEQKGRETVGKAKPSVVNQEDSVRVKKGKEYQLSIQEQWKPPCESIIKINFDGAFDVHQARLGFGVVARNSSGEMLASMVVCHKTIPSLFAAEAHACYQALRLGVRLGLDSTVIEGGSLTIIKKCRSDRRDNGDWDHYCKCSTLQ